MARLAVGYALIALVFHFAWPQVGALIAWVAETLLFALSSTPYPDSVSWTEYGYAVSDRLLMKPALVPVRSLPVLIGIPLGFALALPGFGARPYFIRVLVAASASVALAGTTVALIAAQHSRARTAPFGIELYPDWQIEILNTTVGAAAYWDLGMDLFPLVICALLSCSAYGLFALRDRSGSRWLAPLCIAALVLPLAVLLGSASSARNASRDVLVDALSTRNPTLGSSLLLLGDHFAKQSDVESATAWYREAGSERRYADQAALRIRSLDRER